MIRDISYLVSTVYVPEGSTIVDQVNGLSAIGKLSCSCKLEHAQVRVHLLQL
jgi:hypothetical protein